MALDVSTEQLVRAGGSFLLALVGISALLLAKRRVPALALGGLLACTGLAWTGNNLFQGNVDVGRIWFPLAAILFAGSAAFWLLLLLRWPIAVRVPERRFVWISLAVGAVIGSLAALEFISAPGGWQAWRGHATVPSPSMAWTKFDFATIVLRTMGYAAVAVMMPLRFAATLPQEHDLRRRLAFGGFFLVMSPLGIGAWLLEAGSWLSDFSLHGGDGLGPLVACVAWLFATTKASGNFAARVALGILALALVGMLLEARWPENVNDDVMDAAVGIQRSIWAFALAYGIARFGLLGHDIKLRTARRGTLAAGALATLFIVAQVMQNFLSAKYGLLMGGVIAGTVLFAANPVQRAIERIGERRPAPHVPRTPGNGHAQAATAQETTFRDAVRLAFKDRRFSAQEEVTLAELAEGLGLSARRAVEIRHDVERENGVR